VIRKIVGAIAFAALFSTSSLAQQTAAPEGACTNAGEVVQVPVCMASPGGGNQNRSCQLQCVGNKWVLVPGTCGPFTGSC
jgi:hypothetical protein